MTAPKLVESFDALFDTITLSCQNTIMYFSRVTLRGESSSHGIFDNIFEFFHREHSPLSWTTPGRLNRAAAVGSLLIVMSSTCFATDSCDPIRTFADGKKPLREIFVATTGNNSSGDGTRIHPYQTISRALQVVQPGEAIRLLGGTYPGGTYVGAMSGTSNAPIWIGGVPGQPRPILTGGSGGMHLSRVQYLILENLEISGAAGNGVNCDDGGDYSNPNASHHLLFRNLSIHDVGTGGNQDGLKLSGIYDYHVLDCEFARQSAGGSGIDHVGCHRGMIARCTFTDMGNAVQCKGGSADIEIRWNRFLNGGGRAVNIGGSTGFQFFRPPLSTTAANAEARDIRVIANLFRGSESPIAFVGSVDCLVANNTIVEPRRWILRILQETVSSDRYVFRPCGNNRFINNLISFDRAQISTPINIGANTDASSFEFSHNLWHAFNETARSRPTLPAAEAEGLYGLNPIFRDASTDGFSVSPSSPVIGKGRKLPNVKADLFERCYADPPTLGAFEARPPTSAK